MERLLKLLNPPADSGKQPKRYVQEQVVTSLAMVADVSERGFAKVRTGSRSLHVCTQPDCVLSALSCDYAIALKRVAKRKGVGIPQTTAEGHGVCWVNR